ncbi:hypothetical protein BC828DRAFT_385222 [Blastocladiella britannica]|nr:hypothetical protein BC828DRAFT_385222 [Blastocladiella britannica]
MNTKATLLALVAAAIAVASASAQITGDTGTTVTPPTGLCGNGADATFNACLGNAASLQQIQCIPLQAAQGYPYLACMCQSAANEAQCYDQCPGQASQKLIVQSKQTSFCTAADGLKPKSSSSSQSPSSSTASNVMATVVVTATATPTAKATNAAAHGQVAGAGAAVAAVAALALFA